MTKYHMEVAWIRHMGGGLAFKRPHTHLAYGIRGSGKSSLLEHIAENHLTNGLSVIDLFGSRDGEGLAWCRSPWVEDKSILLIHGDNTSVASSFDSKSISNYSLSDVERYDIIISASPLYSSINVEYRDINRILDSVYQRLVWKKVSNIIVREAANLLYSRMKVSADQILAKAKMAYFIREARHTGFSLSLDTLKFTSIDLDVRVTIDNVFFKSLGIQGLPPDLKWLYTYIKPFAIQRMRPEEFCLLTSSGSIGIGRFPEVKWHKDEGEDIMGSCGIQVEHGDELVENFEKTLVGDLEHARFVERRLDGESYASIAGIDWSDQTVINHCNAHNTELARHGVCQRCKRAKSEHSSTKIPHKRSTPHRDTNIPPTKVT